jgi:hypothetical protein
MHVHRTDGHVGWTASNCTMHMERSHGAAALQYSSSDVAVVCLRLVTDGP